MFKFNPPPLQVGPWAPGGVRRDQLAADLELKDVAEAVRLEYLRRPGDNS